MKRILIILSLVFFLLSLGNAQLRVDSLKADVKIYLPVGGLQDSTVTLSDFTTAAYNYIGSGGSITNNPDDVTLENKAGETIGITHNYLVDSVGQSIEDSLGYGHPKNVLSIEYGAVGDGITDDTDEIQAALDEAGYVYLPYTGNRYVISSDLRIKSNTYLYIQPGVEIYLANSSNDYMITNYNITTGTLDSNIVIDGGLWNANGSNNTGTASYPSWQGHMAWIDSIKNLTIKNTFVKDATRYAWMISHFEILRTYNNGFNTEKDGFHLSVGNDYFIEKTYGHTGDDMIANTISNYSSYHAANDGHMENGTIKDVHAYAYSGQNYGAQCIVSLVGCGNNSYKFKNIKINNIRGTANTYGIRSQTGLHGGVYFPNNEQYTYFENVFIKDINVNSIGTYPAVYLKVTGSNNLNISNVELPANNMGAITLGDTTTGSEYVDTRISNIHGLDSTKTLVWFDSDSSTFKRTFVKNISGRNNPSLFLFNCGQGTFEDGITFSDIVADSINILTCGYNGNFDNLNIWNYQAKDISNPIQVKKSATITLNNGHYNNCDYSIRVYGSGATHRILGDNISYSGATTARVATDNLGTLSINNPDLRMYTNQLTPQQGDRVYSYSSSTNSSPNTVVYYDTTDAAFHHYQQKYRFYTFNFDPPNITAGSYADTSWTITGINPTDDFIICNAPYNLQTYFTWSIRISATHTVTLTLHNADASAHNDSEKTWRILWYDKP